MLMLRLVLVSGTVYEKLCDVQVFDDVYIQNKYRGNKSPQIGSDSGTAKSCLVLYKMDWD